MNKKERLKECNRQEELREKNKQLQPKRKCPECGHEW